MNEQRKFPAPDWYPDPENPGTWRFWDGQAWTDHHWQGPPGQPPRVARPRSRGSRMARAAYLAFMVVVGLFAGMMASVFFSGFTYFLAPGEAESEDPSTQPLEVVAAPDSCVLNVAEVATGMHEVVVLAERGRYRVLIRDPSGKVIFVAVTRPPGEPGTQRTVPLDAGTYRVECRGAARTIVAELRVLEAS